MTELTGAPHQPPATSVGAVMRQVLYALTPVAAAQTWFFGWGVIAQILLAAVFALGFEAAMLKLRQRPLRPFITDGSALIAAVLFALCIPPLAPWWVAATGMLFAIVIAKHLYGGLGHNLFNPAMVGFAAVIIAFPAELSQWLLPGGVSPALPGLADTLHTIFTGRLPAALDFDAITGATPLDAWSTGISQGLDVEQIRQQAVFSAPGGHGWQWIAAFATLGGLWLMTQRVISWHVPAAVVVTTLLIATPLWLAAPDTQLSPVEHLFTGALMLGAFFIATDPVSGCASPRGKLIFGAGVAILTLVIRRWGGYPDGLAFAILLMNMTAPLIDRLTVPRAYGH